MGWGGEKMEEVGGQEGEGIGIVLNKIVLERKVKRHT